VTLQKLKELMTLLVSHGKRIEAKVTGTQKWPLGHAWQQGLQ